MNNINKVNKPANSPTLNGITLEAIVTSLSVSIGWEQMAVAVPVRCFTHDPSIKSSLKFLRRTPWARAKVEQLYLQQAKIEIKEKSTEFPPVG
jgi:uncharacterized protein (DUF2132 family)